MAILRNVAVPVIAAVLATPALAARLQNITPGGEVAEPAQVVVTLQEAAVPLGQADAPAPVQVRCDNDTAEGTGRWVDERRWVYDFSSALVSGIACTVTPDTQFRDLNGQPLAPFTHHFNTGGPRVVDILPETWDTTGIDEQQYFILQLSGPAEPASIQAHAWCSASDMGERIAIQMLPAEQTQEILRVQRPYLRDEVDAQTLVGLACQRRFTPGSKVQLVWGGGIAAPNGLKTSAPQQFEYTVRTPFEATFSCQREQASSGCIPVLPMELTFSAPVAMQWLSQIILATDQRQWHATALIQDRWGYSVEETITTEQWLAEPDKHAGKTFTAVRFEGPFPEQARFQITLPESLLDDAGRPLHNTASFPLQVATDAAPPLAKFATGDFAVIERFAEGYRQQPLVPVTLRAVETPLPVRVLRLDSDADIIEWMFRTDRLRPGQYVARDEALELGVPRLPEYHNPSAASRQPRAVEARMLSLLEAQPQAQTLQLPASSDNPDRRATEVVGIPVEPGFQVLEIASPVLGQALLDPDYRGGRTLYARTTVLVTNLAVHFKLGAENAMAWVTELDSGQPVAGAAVQVNRCDGSIVATATTDAQGIARFDDLAGRAPECSRAGMRYWNHGAYMVSARSKDGKDLGLVWTNWQRGIESWRFNVPTDYQLRAHAPVAHTVLDRTLLRAGETVSMKHIVREQSLQGFAAPAPESAALPDTMVVRHLGSGREFEQPLAWSATSGGGVLATSQLQLPRRAPLGRYSVTLHGGAHRYGVTTASFRVEEFRLPVMQGTLAPIGEPDGAAAEALPMQLHLGYVSGGPAANWPVQVSAMLEPHSIQFPDYAAYTFAAPRLRTADGDVSGDAAPAQRLLLDKHPLKLDAQGNVTFEIEELNSQANRDGAAAQPRNLRVEATFSDPNGEMQTLTRLHTLWPADTLVGLSTDSWISVDKPLPVRTIALTPSGQPVAQASVTVRARTHTTLTSRKRMVGGFYKYEHHYESKDLGTVCEGRSDASGRFDCVLTLDVPGEVELIAEVSDARQRRFAAATSVWVTRKGQLWFDGEASDRMDVLAEKPSYQPGETARFQVRMPYRKATALVAVEREGIVETHVVDLAGDDPSFTLRVDEAWSPNIYVSVLALRGRLREVPWYSFFTWGFRSPVVWWRAWRADTGEDAPPPTAMVDLSKPSYRFGVAAIRVGHEGHRLHVRVTPDKPRYATGETASLTIQATLPDGSPAAHGEVALAVVDQALLELAPNPSWDLLAAMMQTRSWAVQTSTAQMEVVGRRHYGRKAAPAGGGGGSSGDGATRELFDTLLAWLPRVPLDAQGRATVQIPINDSITTFLATAVAEAGVQYFGTGSTALVVAQDLQIISGLPPVVREGDDYDARFTLRNASDADLTVEVSASHGEQPLPPQRVTIAAGTAETLHWRVTTPSLPLDMPQANQPWRLQARATAADGSALQADAPADRVALTQTIVPSTPVTVRQASLRQIAGPIAVQVGMPAGAIEGRGGVRVEAQASLAGDLMPGLQRWWRWYPYACIEQRHGKAIGLMNLAAMEGVLADLPDYLDDDGLAAYFPPRRPDSGNIYLTAHLLAVDAVLGTLGEEGMRMDEATRQRMLNALTRVVEGRLDRPTQAPRQDRTVTQLMLIAALAGHGVASPSMLEPLTIAPQRLPTHALLDWLSILKQMPQLPGHAEKLTAVEQQLHSRILQTGAQVLFTTERNDDWWWMMQNGDSNAARLVLLTADLPGWQQDIGNLASGLLARQRDGAWSTTTANVWGQLAIRRFAQLHEREPVSGSLQAQLGAAQQTRAWPSQQEQAGGSVSSPTNTSTERLQMDFAWPDAIARVGDPDNASRLRITQQGSGKPWVTISALAAVPLTQPVSSGLRVEKTITPLVQAQPGQWQAGDIYRVNLVIHSQGEAGLSALSDPIPAGSTILGSGLGRDSAIATADDASRRDWSVAWEERKMDMMRVYFDYLRQGQTRYSYTVRLNQPGTFTLPPTRVEALYMQQVFGEVPNPVFNIGALPATP
ncbi:hypothetical protein AAV94_14255 [Lampropedia cohaerens]|uniref:Alpha-2-macroglobulin n=1 Tax=Lampropedia cohaerens TaxID=1610491 RepID=A0A0U1PWR0_9BURK|nr:MG2 domain-containing protein [Lampropedia cohaerens]KKW66877.1 hypothetical protein AAV94_14255 [Lampropedia cohaerens]